MANSAKINGDRVAIEKFVKSITEKNYAEANKYLKVAVEEKLKAKIAAAAKEINI
jgi:hypothetical protein